MTVETITRTKCDRCGQIDERKGNTLNGTLPTDWRIMGLGLTPNEVFLGEIILCPACLQLMKVFLQLNPEEPRTPIGDPNFERPVELPIGNLTNTNYKPETSTVKKNLTVQRPEGKPVATGKDIFSTFEIKVPGDMDVPYIFRMGGQEVKSKILVAGVEKLLALCGITGDLGEYSSSPQLQQVKNILFSVEHLE